jgi:chemotaxis protein methyltransferase CheR
MSWLMSDDEFRLFRNLIHQECGLYFSDSKKVFLSSRIAKRVVARSLPSFYRYYRYLEEAADRRAELLLLLDLLTINETAFFRNPPQFRLLAEVVLPDLLETRAAGPLRGWSAGCSSGEEPYSIAITLLERLPADRAAFQIFASDLSLSALERAASGVYPPSAVRDVDPARLARFFEPRAEGYAVREEVKKNVVYDFHNLKHDNGLRDLDVVFCRNVLIYFDAEEQKKILDRFIRALRPGGYLFLGHSESVQGLVSDLKFVHKDKGTAYRKVLAA